MSWRYRVMRHKGEGPEPDHLMIHEVYDGGGHTADGVRAGSDSIEGLHDVLMMMRAALRLPVLDYAPESESTEAER